MTESLLNVYYILIGELATSKILYELELEDTNAKNIAKECFSKSIILKTHENMIEKLKMPSNSSIACYYYVTENRIFIFIAVNACFAQNQVFKLFDEIVKQNIHFMSNDTGLLNKNGKNILKSLIAQYQENVIEINHLVQEGLKAQTAANDGKVGTKLIVRSSDGMADRKENLTRPSTCRRNLKKILIISGIGIILLVIIILPIVLSQLPSGQTLISNATLNNSVVNTTRY
jgi:hypothetical protein